jgi:hypothetical protein
MLTSRPSGVLLSRCLGEVDVNTAWWADVFRDPIILCPARDDGNVDKGGQLNLDSNTLVESADFFFQTSFHLYLIDKKLRTYIFHINGILIRISRACATDGEACATDGDYKS